MKKKKEPHGPEKVPEAVGTRKQSYTVPCSSAFRDQVLALATRRAVNVGDLARSVTLVLPADVIAKAPDPGEPDQSDREMIILKSGRSKGRPWRRKPRLQVRMVPGLAVPFIRRSLGLALAMDRGDMGVSLTGAAIPGVRDPEALVAAERSEREQAQARLRETREEIDRLQGMILALSFDPLPQGVTSREDALHVLGFRPGAAPDLATLRGRFRALAAIHHPDGAQGDHRRMSQLNAAMEYLRRYVA